MLSPFTARRAEEPGSGGKAPRGSRRAVSVSPYARPENSPPPPAREAGNPRWFSGIITGAGRLLSSVFRSDSGDSSSSDSSDADEGGRGSSDEDENADACVEELHELDEIGRSCKSCTTHGEGLQLITQRSDRALAIEKLLLQETFSRDEGDRLTKIIQSQVVDNMEGGKVAGQIEFPDKTFHSDPVFVGAQRSLNRERKFPEGRTYSASHLNDHFSGTSILHAYSHDLCDKAIMEAKKWLEKKKIESTSKSKPDCGPRTLNTDAHQYCVEDEVDSPVDIAKSYMQARPPWQSPLLSSIGFKSPRTGMLLFKDETPFSVRGDSFSTSKALKRGYPVADLDDTRSVRLKSLENPLDPSISQIESSNGMLEREARKTADEKSLSVASTNHDLHLVSAIESLKSVDAPAGIPEKLTVETSCAEVTLNYPDERADHVNNLHPLASSEVAKLVDSSPSIAAKLAVEDGCPDSLEANFTLHGEKTFEENQMTNEEVVTEADKIDETCNLNSANFVPEPEDNVNGETLIHEISTQPVLAPELEAGQESLSSGSDFPDLGQRRVGKDLSLGPESTDILIICTSQDLEVSPPMEKQDKSLSVASEFTSPESSVHHGVSDAELLNVEPEELPLEGVRSSSLSVHIDPSATEIRQDHRSPQSELLPAFEVKDTPVDARLVDGKDLVEKEAISTAGFTANGDLYPQPGSPSNPYIGSLKKGSHHLPSSSNGRSVAATRAETRQLITDAPVDVPVGRGTRGNPKKRQNGTTMKSIEQMLAENSPNSRRRGGRRVAAKPRRGRGTGK